MEWISVKDKLPDTEVIAYGHQGEMLIGYVYFSYPDECYVAENDGAVLLKVTDWQYKPEPPNGKQ